MEPSTLSIRVQCEEELPGPVSNGYEIRDRSYFWLRHWARPLVQFRARIGASANGCAANKNTFQIVFLNFLFIFLLLFLKIIYDNEIQRNVFRSAVKKS